MDIDEAVTRACTEPTLLDALNFICVWETERVVKFVRTHSGSWDTMFKHSMERVIKEYVTDTPDLTSVFKAVKVPSHITVSPADSCGSRRYLCRCGTHFNSSPSYSVTTREWLEKHSHLGYFTN